MKHRAIPAIVEKRWDFIPAYALTVNKSTVLDMILQALARWTRAWSVQGRIHSEPGKTFPPQSILPRWL
jgi:hypothetical protein